MAQTSLGLRRARRCWSGLPNLLGTCSASPNEFGTPPSPTLLVRTPQLVGDLSCRPKQVWDSVEPNDKETPT